MKKQYVFLPILFLYIFSEWKPVLAYDQVKVETVIPLVNKSSKPGVLRVDKDGNLWILNQSASMIQKISRQGRAAASLKPGKKKDSHFRAPSDFAFTPDGLLVVADPALSRVVVIEEKKIRHTIPVPHPLAVAVSREDVLAVGEKGRNEISLYSMGGVLLHQLSSKAGDNLKTVSSLAFSKDGVLWVLDGAAGHLHRFSPDRSHLGVTTGLDGGQHVAVDEFGFAYVTLREGRWKEIDREGRVTGTFGTSGKGSGELLRPVGIAVTSATDVWVSEEANNRLQKFSVLNSQKQAPLVGQPAARLQVRRDAQWGGAYSCGFIDGEGRFVLLNAKETTIDWFSPTGKDLQSLTLTGKNKLGLVSPAWIAEDPEGRLWVADRGDHKIKRLGDKFQIAESIGERGRKEGNFVNPTHFTFRPDRSLVVVDRGSSRVQVLSPKGLFQFSVGKQGRRAGEYRSVNGVAASSSTIALIDNDLKALNFYDSKGRFISSVANRPDQAPVWKNITSLSTDDKGRYHVIDQGLKKLRIYGPEGRFLAEFAVDGNRAANSKNQKIMVMGDKSVEVYEVVFFPASVPSLTARDDAGSLQISWKPEPDSVQYRVYRSSDAGDFSPVITTSATETMDMDVVPGISYRYAVAGVNSLGYEGTWALTDPVKASRRKDLSLISITTTSFSPIFTAAFKSYVTKPFGTLTVRNNDSKPYRNVKISLLLKRYTDFATESVIPDIGPAAEITVPVTLTFNDSVLELTENTPVQLEVRLIYYEDNAERIVTQNAPLTLYSRNAISWTDPSRLSSFVTPRDGPVVEFSRAAIRNFLIPLRQTALPQALAKTALLVESVGALGLSYVPDPKTPFAEAAGRPEILDYVQFPRETLHRKTGDCDDTTALMSALLESIGLEAAFAEVPGHVFVMVNTEEHDIDVLGFPGQRFVEYRGSFWLPIETTRLGKGFQEAWQSASTRARKAQGKNQLVITTVYDASKKYPPVTLTEKSDPVPFPEKELKSTFPDLLQKLSKERYQNRVASMRASIRKNPADPMLSIQLGMVHAEGGNSAEAAGLFRTMIKHPNSDVQGAAQNNLGNLAFLEGRYKEAADHYREASALSPDDGGILINQARTALKLGDPAGAKTFLADAKLKNPNWRDFVADFPAEILP